MVEAEINGIVYNYETAGEGDPVLLIPGYGGSTGFWRKAVAVLAERFTAICVDNRGAGGTVCDPGFTIGDMAADAAALLDRLGVGPAHVIGWSMGSHVAQRLAIDHPAAVRSLTLVSTYGRRPARSAYLLDAAVRAVEEGAAPELIGIALNTLNYTEGFFGGKEADGTPIRVSDIDDIVMAKAQMDAVNASDTSDEARLIAAPALCIHGTDDIMIDISEGERIAGMIPDCRFLRIEGEGHWIPVAAYLPAVLDFIGAQR